MTLFSPRTLRRPAVWCGALIFALALGLYLQTGRFAFVDYDDALYVFRNEHVIKGLCAPSILWAFGDTGALIANWHPLTFLSLMADVSLFGVAPGPMHLHNALLHALNSVLVFALLALLLKPGGRCSATAPSAAALALLAAALAALFWSVHPLRVESVAWVSSRKDVLCGFWYLAGTLLWVRSVQGQTRGAWPVGLALLCFVLAYMSKPTAVVFPVTLLLLEVALTRNVNVLRIVPFVALAALFAGVTVYTQHQGGALDTGALRAGLRCSNAVAAVGQYVSTTVVPRGLAYFYPYEVPVPLRRLVPGALFLLASGAFVCGRAAILILTEHARGEGPYGPATSGSASFRQVCSGAVRRFLAKNRRAGGRAWPLPAGEAGARDLEVLLGAAGLLWFVAALLPVVGLLQVGNAACADRYTYLPGIGLSLSLAVLLRRLLAPPRVRLGAAVCAGMAGVLVALGAASVRQTVLWGDSVALFTHATRAVKHNQLAHSALGRVYFENGEYERALRHFLESAKALLSEASARDLSVALAKTAGERHTNDVLLQPVAADDPLAAQKHHAMGLVAAQKGLDFAAESHLKKAAELMPCEPHVWQQLGFVCERQGRLAEAEAMFARASQLNPSERGLRAKLRQVRALRASNGDE